jgi:hypothetical protein
MVMEQARPYGEKEPDSITGFSDRPGVEVWHTALYPTINDIYRNIFTDFHHLVGGGTAFAGMICWTPYFSFVLSIIK